MLLPSFFGALVDIGGLRGLRGPRGDVRYRFMAVGGVGGGQRGGGRC